MKKPLLGEGNVGGTGENVELVTVPALGAEWSKNELYSQTRRAKQEARREKRGKMWREWNRDQRGCCGVGWMTKRMLVVVTFAFLAALGVTLYFVIPRAPNFSFPSDTVFLADESTVGFSRTPANFSFTGDIRMIADASTSWLPVHFNHLEITVLDMNTNKKIGTGDWKDKTIGRKGLHYLSLPVDFSYSAVNATDSTWSGMYNACGHRWTGTERPDLSFRVTLKMNIRGLVGKPTVSRLATDLECPFELPSNSV
ncbi:hypothetical protein HD553DRAFT_265989 [Filobasidium floriforme]|uniref:uncharacterized protein n=1 Tax=Filobasidium floriforme TaxID=5210 RepID=UPI001E8CF436|nr:uncharacterized protein HD553DRAFT_265989 [Filobasidium floriforme]KAH8090725.1 hypothetical protein HD553DRAFT_265989 [Filobasidium floriforme]